MGIIWVWIAEQCDLLGPAERREECRTSETVAQRYRGYVPTWQFNHSVILILAVAMSAHKPEDALSQNQSCVTDELTAVDSSLQNQEEEEEDREQKETHSDAYPCDHLGAEAVVSDGTGSTSSDESDSEHFSGGGYTLLPQEPGDEKQSDWKASDGGCSAREKDVVNTRTGGADTGPVGAVSQLEECKMHPLPLWITSSLAPRVSLKWGESLGTWLKHFHTL